MDEGVTERIQHFSGVVFDVSCSLIQYTVQTVLCGGATGADEERAREAVAFGTTSVNMNICDRN